MDSIAKILLGVFVVLPLQAQQVPGIDHGQLTDLLTNQNEDTTYVVNFWATWCAPCVDEIGHFEKLHRDFKKNKVNVILINLDFPNQVSDRVVSFLSDRDITAPVMNMTDMDYNKWIPLVDKDWSGAIPATLIFKGSDKKFIHGAITEDELYSYVEAMDEHSGNN